MAAPNSFRLIGLLVLFAASTSLAYVLPSYSILRRMVERRDKLALSALQVKGTAVFAPSAAASALGAPEDREVQADATFSMRLPGRCRLDVSVAEGNTASAIFANGKLLNEGGQIPSLNQAVTQLCAALALRSGREGDARAGLERHLRGLRIEDKKTSLARLDQRIVYALGADAEDAPQFQVYKDSFLPARIRYSDAEGVQWDVRLQGFGSPVAGDWFPRLVEVWKNGQPALKFTALEANAAVKLPDALFAPAAPKPPAQ